MNRKDLLGRLESLQLLSKDQITKATVSHYSIAMEEERFALGEIFLEGIGKSHQADIVSLTVSLNKEIVKTAELSVASGSRDRYRITLDADIASRYSGKQVECSFNLGDKYGRELAVTSADVTFGGSKKQPVFQIDGDFVESVECEEETNSALIIKGSITSDSDVTACLCLLSDGKPVWQNNISLVGSQTNDYSIMLGKEDLHSEMDQEFEFKVLCDGEIIYADKAILSIKSQVVAPPTVEVPFVVGDLVLPDYVDVHTAVRDSVSIGTLLLYNNGSETDVVVSVVLDGNNLFLSRMHIFSDEKEIDLTAPFTTLAREETSTRELVARVVDMSGNLIMCKTVSLRVRSKFDLDLSEIKVRTAQFINPRNNIVEALVHDSEGPLAAVMGDDFSIMGYQLNGKYVIPQVQAVYDMLYSSKMKYVSDTFTYDRANASYQHVKTPGKVFLDGSGNCIELSILYASILESMGLEAVVAFPPGHAIVGVVLGTDLYPSRAVFEDYDNIPAVTIEFDGKYADILFIESTACPWCDNFMRAAEMAKDEILKNGEEVANPENILFVKGMRLDGCDPLLGL